MKKLFCSLVMVGCIILTGSTAGAEETAAQESADVVGTVEATAEQPAIAELEAADVAAITDLKPTPLSATDCVKCHYSIAVDIDTHGESHKTEVTCLDCHEEHPPEGTNVIPECSNCHDPGDNDHFAVQGCLNCHNPHHPLLLDFTAADNVAPVCATCHEDKLEEMAAKPSAHSEQDCNNCHLQHGLADGKSMTCLDCHEGHSEEMVIADCLQCHAPHSPADVTYPDDVAASLCAACHEDVATLLAGSGTAHAEMGCAECHSEKHKTIPQCTDCHDQPHGEYILGKFPECLTCHRDPHELAR